MNIPNLLHSVYPHRECFPYITDSELTHRREWFSHTNAGTSLEETVVYTRESNAELFESRYIVKKIDADMRSRFFAESRKRHSSAAFSRGFGSFCDTLHCSRTFGSIAFNCVSHFGSLPLYHFRALYFSVCSGHSVLLCTTPYFRIYCFRLRPSCRIASPVPFQGTLLYRMCGSFCAILYHSVAILAQAILAQVPVTKDRVAQAQYQS